MTELICVDPERVDAVWPHARHLIQQAIERTGLSDFADIERQVLSGDQLLWLAWNGKKIEAAATTQLQKGVCIIVTCGGKQRERWLPLLERIERYAKDEGCSLMRIYGRKGWQRLLNGYSADYVILQKELA